MAGETVDRELIAIVGMAGRFPGAPNVDAFWANLRDGVESIRPFTEAELREAGADTSEPGFVNAGSVMDGIDRFDAAFFGMSRREAELTDPQHRVLLETAWTALEHAGYDPAAYDGRIGIFGGVGPNPISGTTSPAIRSSWPGRATTRSSWRPSASTRSRAWPTSSASRVPRSA